MLVEAAWAASHTKKTYLSTKYRALAARRGKKKALIAIGHKILLAAYHILKDGVKYVELGEDYLAKRQSDRQMQSALAKLTQLGYRVALEKVAGAPVR